jgi:hypothetical protein
MKRLLIFGFLFVCGAFVFCSAQDDSIRSVKQSSPLVYTFVYNKISESSNIPLVGIINKTTDSHTGLEIGLLNHCGNDFRGVQIGFGNAIANNFTGSQIGFLNATGNDEQGLNVGFLNAVGNTMKGCQIGFINAIGNEFEGVQLGFVNAVGNKAKGLQVGFLNSNGNKFHGAEFGFVNLIGNKFTGFQTGFYNKVHKLSGFQLGFLNRVDTLEKGIPFGFLSFVKKGGYQSINVGVTEMFPVNISYKTGIEKLYTSINVAYGDDSNNHFAAGFGVGTFVPLGGKFAFNPEFTSMHPLLQSWQQLYSLKLNVNYRIADHFSAYAGLSVTWNHINSPADDWLIPFWSVYTTDINQQNRILTGINAGLSYRF